MKNKLLIKISLLILSTLITFGVAELILRLSGFNITRDVYEYDSETGLNTLKPNLTLKYETECFSTEVKANSQGFHDHEFSLEKPEDVYRIAIIGDSFIEARNVQIEESLQYILEQKLNELSGQPKHFEIYAFGIAGNGTFKNYLYLNQYVLSYKPDLIILFFLPLNDFLDDYVYISKMFDERGNIKTRVSAGERLIKKSIFLTWLDYKWQIAKTKKEFNFLRKLFSPKDFYSEAPFDFQVFLKDYPRGWYNVWDMEKKLLKTFRDTVKENGAQFFLVSINDIWRAHPEILQDNEYYHYFNELDMDFYKPEKILTEFTKEENIPYLALAPILRERILKEGEMTFSLPCDAHWNATGNLWAAEAIFQFLIQEENKYLLNI